MKNMNVSVLLNNNKIPKPNNNFVIIPMVDSGNNLVTLLSNDNTFTTSNFYINTDNNCSYAYKLVKGANELALTDLVNNGKVLAANTIDNASSGTTLNIIHFAKDKINRNEETNELTKEEIKKEKKEKKEIINNYLLLMMKTGKKKVK
jgi:hypothetical protein